jgi:hypothetical protein
LIPLYLLPILPDGLEVTSINGHKKIVGKDVLDKDVRFGCIAYVITIGPEKVEDIPCGIPNPEIK